MHQEVRAIFRRYPIYFAVWTMIGFFFFSQDMTRKVITRDPLPWWHYLETWMIGVWALALFTPVIFTISRRWPIERRDWIRRAAMHMVFSVIFAVVDVMLVALILPNLGVFPAYMKTVYSTFMFMATISASLHGNVVMYWTLLAIEHGFRYYRNYQERSQEALRLELHASELKAMLVREQLSALKMQLQPHFLFNTLNAIMVLVRQQKARQAEEMIASLSDLLRCVLDDVEVQEVSLRRELEYLQLYLSIEQARFQDRLRVEISTAPDVLDTAVPQMALQPIVENAIRHGIGRSSTAGQLRISAYRVNESVEIKVEDDGPGFGANPGQGSGIGLSNTRARLEQLHGSAAALRLENLPAGGAAVTLVLPFRKAAEAAEIEAMEVHAADNPAR